MNTSRIVPVLLLLISLLSLGACAQEDNDNLDAISGEQGDPRGGKADVGAEKARIGVLLTSHGDIDEFEEIEDYIRTAFLKNVGVPLPRNIRELIEDPAYWIARKEIEDQYAIIGPTRYRANAILQAEALEAELRERGMNVPVFIGYNFMPDFIEDAMAQAQAAGVERLVVFNKGAQFSLATLGESIEEIEGYLKLHPEWDVEVTAVRQFSDDDRFRELFAEVLVRDAKKFFPDVPPADVCLFVASHGLPIRLIDMGDPAVEQMEAVVKDLRERLPQYPIYHGYLNDDFFPGAEWVAPASDDVAWQIRQDSCPAVLMDGRLSFTTHHRATLYDLDVSAREIIEEPDLQPNGEPHPLYTPLEAVLAPQWDDDPGFAKLLGDLTLEALRGEGDLIEVSSHAASH